MGGIRIMYENDKFSYVVTPTNIIFTINDVVYNVVCNSDSGKNLKKILDEHRKTGNIDMHKVMNIISPEKMKNYISKDTDKTGITITDNNNVLLDGEVINDELGCIIKKHYYAGIDFDYLVKFIHKLRENPSYRIREQLYKFIRASMEYGGFTIDKDGDILAYKKVRNDYKDIYTGTFDNHPGMVISMNRRDVNDDPNETCSAGLHFCAYSYLGHYENSYDDRIMLVKVNPADVVSIPYDYNNAKARCCRYKVVCEVNKPLEELVHLD